MWGLPALALEIGFVLLLVLPVYLAAKIVRAAHATLLRSGLSLILSTFLMVLGFLVTGAGGFLIAPLAFIASFRFVLGTSFFGALCLALLALLFYALMVHFVGGGFSFGPGPVNPGVAPGSGTV
jgi:hypothetical protein